MANATNTQVGRSVGHEWAVSVATSGQFCWPPTGSSYWPLTGDLAICNIVVGQWGVEAIMALVPGSADADAQLDYLGDLMLAFAKSNEAFGSEI